MSNSRLRSLVLFLAALFFVCHQPLINQHLYAQDSQAKEEEAYFVAQKAFDDKFYDVALGLFERLLKNYPQTVKRPDIELTIGQCYFFQNKFLEALQQFQTLRDDPRSADVKDACLYWIAEVHFRGNDFKSAAVNYKRIIEEFPRSQYLRHAYYSLGWSLFQEGNYGEALDYFKAVVEKYPKEDMAAEASFKAAECYYYLKDYSALKSYLLSYLKDHPDDKSKSDYIVFYLAEADYYLENFPAAVEQYGKLVQSASDPKIQVLSRLGLAWSNLKLNKYQEAESALTVIDLSSLSKKDAEILLLGKGVLFTQTQRYQEAIGVYDELLRSEPSSPSLLQAFIGKADALSSLSKYPEAILVYKEAFDRAQGLDGYGELIDKLHYGCAWACLKEGQFKDAINEFQKVAAKSEDKIVKVAALCQVGDAYQDAAEYQKAAETYDIILKDYPDSFYSDYVQYQLGSVFLKQSNYDGAILAFKSMMNNFPKSKLLDKSYYALGLAYFQKEDYVSSTDIFRGFTAKFKDSNLCADSMYLLGTSLYNAGKFQEAIEVFKDIIRSYGQNIPLVQKSEYEIADCMYRMGNEEEAVNKFKSLRSKYPDSSLTPDVVWWLGEYYYRLGKYDIARRYFLAIIQDYSKSNLLSDSYYALGTIAGEEGDLNKAGEYFRKVIENADADFASQATVALADIFVKKGDLDLALNTYQDAIKRYPNLTALLYPKIADIYKSKGDLDDAIATFRKSLEVAPLRQMGALQFKIAECLDEQGKNDEAVEEYLKITYLYPEDKSLAARALLRTAQIYENKEKPREAINIYKKVVAMGAEESKFAQERITALDKDLKAKSR
ncbi:MAG: tetratricopeptide repeat protein [Candidatus Omnitrophica bacterium]|nr:tetratricopeptide repeat protein [Candidatus Omnitrophota bacterium]